MLELEHKVLVEMVNKQHQPVYPLGVWRSTMNVLYTADLNNHRIPVVNSNGIINTFVGHGHTAYSSSDENQPATSVSLYLQYMG